MEDISDIIENIAINYNELEPGKAYMKQQISDFYKTNKIKIDFNYCHIALSRNGGLIAICKVQNYFDISKTGKLNNNIIVMFQNAKIIYEIKIDWNFNKRWIVCLDFTYNQKLYGILNDGGIFKFNYRERKRKEKITAPILKEEGIKNAKFFKNGFIAQTPKDIFYYIKDIKNPMPIMIYDAQVINLPPQIDFITISEDNSKSNRIELLLTYGNGNGVVHIEQKKEGSSNYQVNINNENAEVIGINLLLKGELEPYSLNNERQRQKGEYPDGFGKIAAIAISPSGKKIALYNNIHKVAFIINSNFNGNYSKIFFKFNQQEHSKEEINEFNAILEYKQHNQFLFCGEDAVAIVGQRFIILSSPKAKEVITYLIKEGGEFLAMQGNAFCKCASEIDGLRVLTGDGVYLINQISKELYDITYPFSNAKSKNLLKIYLNTFSPKYNSHKDIKNLPDIEPLIFDLQLASANIFWTKEDEDEQKKKIQLFLLKAAQYGKNFVKEGEFNFDKFNAICKDIRIVNQLRNDDYFPLFITFKEYQEYQHLDIIEILIQYKNFKSASQISNYLEYDTQKIMYKFMIEKMKHKIKIIEKSYFKENEIDEEKIYQELLDDIEKLKDISYVKLAKKAIQFGNEKFAMKLLDQEKSALTKIPQLLELNKIINSLSICFETFDFNIISIVLDKISKNKLNSKFDNEEIFFENLCKPELQKHHSKIILFFKKYKPEKLEFFLLKTKNYNELLYLKLDKLFNSHNSEEKLSIIKEIKADIKNYDPKFKKYIENLENFVKFRKSCLEESIIHYSEKNIYNKNIYECFLEGCKKGKFNFIEGKNKNLEYSSKKLNIIRFRAYLQMNRPEAIDEQLEKTSLKKLGLTPMNMAEIYYDYKFYDKATEYILQVKESNYSIYCIELLKNMGKYKEALELIISDKDIEDKAVLVREILVKDPELKNLVDELSVKYKVSLW